jgi:hypothetical protein
MRSSGTSFENSILRTSSSSRAGPAVRQMQLAARPRTSRDDALGFRFDDPVVQDERLSHFLSRSFLDPSDDRIVAQWLDTKRGRGASPIGSSVSRRSNSESSRLIDLPTRRRPRRTLRYNHRCVVRHSGPGSITGQSPYISECSPS